GRRVPRRTLVPYHLETARNASSPPCQGGRRGFKSRVPLPKAGRCLAFSVGPCAHEGVEAHEGGMGGGDSLIGVAVRAQIGSAMSHVVYRTGADLSVHSPRSRVQIPPATTLLSQTRGGRPCPSPLPRQGPGIVDRT